MKFFRLLTLLIICVVSPLAMAGYNCVFGQKYASSASSRVFYTKAQNCKKPSPTVAKRLNSLSRHKVVSVWVYCGGKHKSCMRETEAITKYAKQFYGYLPTQWNGKHIPEAILKNGRNKKYRIKIKPGQCLFAQSRRGKTAVIFTKARCNVAAPMRVRKLAGKGNATMWVRCSNEQPICQAEKLKIRKYLKENNGKLPRYIY